VSGFSGLIERQAERRGIARAAHQKRLGQVEAGRGLESGEPEGQVEGAVKQGDSHGILAEDQRLGLGEDAEPALVRAPLVALRVDACRPQQGRGGLGALLVAGYLGERLVRQRLRPSGWDRLESPLLIMSIALAAAMASLGLGGSRRVPTS